MKKVSAKQLKEAVLTEAIKLKRKSELYEQVIQINEELGKLDEVGMVGSFGFVTTNDASNKTKTGFEAPQNISHIARLEAEMAENKPINEEELNEVDKLKAENETLKQELESIKESLKNITK